MWHTREENVRILFFSQHESVDQKSNGVRMNFFCCGVCVGCVWVVVWCVVCVVVVWCGVCGVCGTDDSQHAVSVQARADYAPNWVAEHLGASSRRPRHPSPPRWRENPWPCTCVHGPKKSTHQSTNSTCGAAQQGHRPP